jgi:predicted RNA-binding protein YlqC (UPF0109 family)
MSKRTSKISSSPKQLGEIHVNDWDFMALMHKDIKEIEISRSLRKLGNIRVTDWDFQKALPTVHRIAYQEVDIVEIVRRTAHYKVMAWDFRSATPSKNKSSSKNPSAPVRKTLSPEQLQAAIERLRNFLQYVVVNLIDEPNHAQIKVREIEPGVLRFKVILVQRDLAMLIGREGHTADAIRRVLKTAAEINGVQALLQIKSHEEEIEMERGD